MSCHIKLSKGTENDSPEMFAEDQLFIILELTHGGTDLEAYHFQSAEQAFSVYQQVAHALAVAECSLEFEHRDLHWGNILISPTRDKISRFCIKGKQIDIATKGVKASFVSLVQREDEALQALFEYQQTPDSALRDSMVQSLSRFNVKSATISRQFILSALSPIYRLCIHKLCSIP
uniref:Protein kinase domain-containing protein n=1 Tax=Timema genevievae TaxID=629358 RepID=A0A7R9PS67_TIMGE|nr:unnamed protein product [Timema genevievae]